MNVILAVTNQKFVAESFFSRYYANKFLLRPKVSQSESPGLQTSFAEWKTISDNEEVLNWVDISTLENRWNIIYLPYQGFASVVYRSRMLNCVDDRIIVAAMDEKFNTPLIPNGLYNILLDTKYKPSWSLFSDMFNDMNHNILLDAEYDVVMNEIAAGVIPLLSDNIIIN
jgi:hypothetical protein